MNTHRGKWKSSEYSSDGGRCLYQSLLVGVVVIWLWCGRVFSRWCGSEVY